MGESFQPPNRIAEKGGGIRKAKFLPDVATMCIDGLAAQMQLCGDLPVALASSDQL